jgi:cell division protease FtsH
LNDLAKNIILWIVIAIVLLTVFQSFETTGRPSEPLDYSAFLDLVDNSQVAEVVFEGETIKGVTVTGSVN